MEEFNILHYEKKVKLDTLIQKLFLKLLKYIFGVNSNFIKTKSSY